MVCLYSISQLVKIQRKRQPEEDEQAMAYRSVCYLKFCWVIAVEVLKDFIRCYPVASICQHSTSPSSSNLCPHRSARAVMKYIIKLIFPSPSSDDRLRISSPADATVCLHERSQPSISGTFAIPTCCVTGNLGSKLAVQSPICKTPRLCVEAEYSLAGKSGDFRDQTRAGPLCWTVNRYR